MRLSKHRRKTQAAMDMTPMIDITFQLLIFFMACSQISQVNIESNVELPPVKDEGVDEQQEDVTITINITEEGEIRVTGKTYSVAELVVSLGDEKVRLQNEPSRIHVVIRADRRGTSRTVNEVVTALNNLGITRVRIAVQSAQESE